MGAVRRMAGWLGIAVVAVGLLGCDDSGSSLGVHGEGGGFVWKPISESDRNLVVLLPPQYRGRVGETYLADSAGNVIEVGWFSGDDINGNRPHFRWTRPGAAYGTDLYVVTDVTDTGAVHWHIPVGGARVEY